MIKNYAHKTWNKTRSTSLGQPALLQNVKHSRAIFNGPRQICNGIISIWDCHWRHNFSSSVGQSDLSRLQSFWWEKPRHLQAETQKACRWGGLSRCCLNSKFSVLKNAAIIPARCGVFYLQFHWWIKTTGKSNSVHTWFSRSMHHHDARWYGSTNPHSAKSPRSR